MRFFLCVIWCLTITIFELVLQLLFWKYVIFFFRTKLYKKTVSNRQTVDRLIFGFIDRETVRPLSSSSTVTVTETVCSRSRRRMKYVEGEEEEEEADLAERADLFFILLLQTEEEEEVKKCSKKPFFLGSPIYISQFCFVISLINLKSSQRDVLVYSLREIAVSQQNNWRVKLYLYVSCFFFERECVWISDSDFSIFWILISGLIFSFTLFFLE